MKKIRVGINGFGRIGRYVAKLCLNHPEIELVMINDLAPAETLVHLFKYDSVHGKLPYECFLNNNVLKCNKQEVRFTQFKEIKDIPWSSFSVDFVIESTGLFLSKELASNHLNGSVKRVILSAPSTTEDILNIVLGVNEHLISSNDQIVSNASCTTNSAAPLFKVLNELCEVESAYITTIHSYTTDQRLHDSPHKDLRRARAAAQSIVPTTTGAAKALTKIFPELANKIGGCGIRVPVPDGSLTDITFNVKRAVTIDEINKAFKLAATTNLKGILDYTEDSIVSVDIIGNKNSCLFDAQLTSVIDKMVKVVGWYDNEIGYSSRIIDLIALISK